MLHAAFPMGLPEWDTVRLTLEGEAGLDGTQVRESHVAFATTRGSERA